MKPKAMIHSIAEYDTIPQKRTFPVRGPYGNFKLTVGDLERPSGRSMTIQDEAFTIREIMDKFVLHGETWEQQANGNLYQENADHDSMDLRSIIAMDLVDRDELMTDVIRRQNDAQNKLRAYREKIDAENAAKAEQAEKDEYQKRRGKDERSEDAPRSEKYSSKKAGSGGKNSSEYDE